MKNYRLGLDLGSTSIGWAVHILKKDDTNKWAVDYLDDVGVRLFPDGRDGKSKEPLAVGRRQARGMRRQRDRRHRRVRKLLNWLVRKQLLPETKQAQDPYFALSPYEARAKAVEGRVEPGVLSRALFHLSKNRGFKSNRKDGESKESGVVAAGVKALEAVLKGRTLGQYLYAQELDPEGQVLFRADSKQKYDVYPSRALVEAEFDAIRDQQSPHHSLSEQDWDEVREIIFWQRPLKPVQRGRCGVFPNEETRAYKAYPSYQRYRIISDINNLRWVDEQGVSHDLEPMQWEAIYTYMMTTRKPSFAGMAKLTGPGKVRLFPVDIAFNLDQATRVNEGNITEIELRKALGSAIDNLELSSLDTVVDILLDSDDETVIEDLQALALGFNEQQITALVDINLKKLAKGAAGLSAKVYQTVVPIMHEQGLSLRDALEQLAWPQPNHSVQPRSFEHLPYYGQALPESVVIGQNIPQGSQLPEHRFGKINNPTVHICLNQLRKVVNALIQRYGAPPKQIVVETTRELRLSPERYKELTREQKKNFERRQAIIEKIKPFVGDRPSREDIQKYMLWEELESIGRRCVFSGKVISCEKLLFSDEIEVEHILPFSKTFDDSMSNKTLAFRHANREKGGRSPYEAFGGRLDGDYIWPDILERVQTLPGNKSWRFASDALERYQDENGDWLARQLNDTAYISRLSRRYLEVLAGVESVWAVPGRLTSLLRGRWRLNRVLGDDNIKNRDDHAHHAVDAFTVGLIDRGLLQKFSRLNKYGENLRGTRIKLPEVDEHVTRLEHVLDDLMISYKPDHSLEGAMYEETAYGVINAKDSRYKARKPITGLTPKQLDAILDNRIKTALKSFLGQYAIELGIDYPALLKDKKNYAKALEAFGHDQRVYQLFQGKVPKRVKIEVQDGSVQQIPSAPYKGYAKAGYAFVDVWKVPAHTDQLTGKKKKESIESRFVSYADVGRQKVMKSDLPYDKPHPAAKKLARIFKRDIIRYKDIDGWKYGYVNTLDASGKRFYLTSPRGGDKVWKVSLSKMFTSMSGEKLHLTELGKKL